MSGFTKIIVTLESYEYNVTYCMQVTYHIYVTNPICGQLRRAEEHCLKLSSPSLVQAGAK